MLARAAPTLIDLLTERLDSVADTELRKNVDLPFLSGCGFGFGEGEREPSILMLPLGEVCTLVGRLVGEDVESLLLLVP